MEEETHGKPDHLWTGGEILDLPNASIWFYGLIRQEDGRTVVSEIYPGHGRCNFNISNDGFDDRLDEDVIKEIYADIGYDILRWNPA